MPQRNCTTGWAQIPKTEGTNWFCHMVGKWLDLLD